MAKKLIEITATYIGERIRFEGPIDTVIGTATTNEGEQITVKGPEDDGEPGQHQTYRFYGSWSSYENKYTGKTEKQFVWKTFVHCEPHGRSGIIKYLQQAPNIGFATAGKLFEKFRSDAVRILREQPDVAAAAIPRLTENKATEAAKWLEEKKATEGCTIDLIDLLDGHGFRKSTAKEAIKTWGNKAPEIIRQNPYRLMRFAGCGFSLTDNLYLDLGLPPARLKRQAMCAAHALDRATSGDTWHYVDYVVAGLAAKISGSDLKPERALSLGVRGRLVDRVWTEDRNGPPTWDGDMQWVADAGRSRNERLVAELVAEAAAESGWRAFVCEIEDISDHQWMKIQEAICGGSIGILGGGPGTGKTYTAARLIRELLTIAGGESIAVAAPTGKAAVRITESLHNYGVNLRATTIHSLLKVAEADGGGWIFEHNRGNPLPFSFLVIDESSMIDTDLMASLMSARAPGCRILFVGDVNQLPPVGHGAPLRDLIKAGLPCGELTEIHRNEGGIVQACADMRSGKRFECTGNLDNAGGLSPEHQKAIVLSTLEEQKKAGLDPVWDCQIVVPVNQKSPMARRELNPWLQKELNPNPPVKGSPFRLEDKVVNTKNGWYPPADPSEKPSPEATVNKFGHYYVANGEQGRVKRVEPKWIEVELQSPERRIRVPRGTEDNGDDEEATGTGCNWDLAYAISVHKSQGSEWPVVLVVIDEYPGAKRLCDRAWLYTAISRAKKECYLVGRIDTAQTMATRNNIDKRKTFLKEWIDEENKKHQMPVVRPA